MDLVWSLPKEHVQPTTNMAKVWAKLALCGYKRECSGRAKLCFLKKLE